MRVRTHDLIRQLANCYRQNVEGPFGQWTRLHVTDACYIRPLLCYRADDVASFGCCQYCCSAFSWRTQPAWLGL